MPVKKLIQMKKPTILFLVITVSIFFIACINHYFYNLNDGNKQSIQSEVEKQLKSKFGDLNQFKADIMNFFSTQVFVTKPAEQSDQLKSNQNDNSKSNENKLKQDEDEVDNPRDYLKKYPFFLDCNKQYKNIIDDNDYSKPAMNETHKLRIVRAVTFYFPIEKEEDFVHEFRWLYRSWIEVLKYEPSKWRTDLIIFVENDSKKFEKPEFFFNQLNCSFKHTRKRAEDEPMCTLLQYVPIRKRAFNLDNNYISLSANDKYHYLLNNISIYSKNSKHLAPFYSFLKDSLVTYNYADSILMSFDGYEYFKTAGFDFLIRSDIDVFLTPLFSIWLPMRCNDFYVGGGGYSNTFNQNRLKRIAKNIGLDYASARNLGSTWYSTPDQFRIVSYLTLFSMGYIGVEEFAEPERQGKVGTILWPEWHYGVLLLYGQNLALNHLIAKKSSNVVKIESLLDYPSGNILSIFKVLHIHVFHGDDMFSKFMFKAGRYDNLELPSNENSTLIKYYALKMALEGKRTNTKDLVMKAKKEIEKKN